MTLWYSCCELRPHDFSAFLLHIHMPTPQAVVILLSLLFASLCVHVCVCVCLLVVLSQPDVLDHVDVSAVSSFTFTLRSLSDYLLLSS